MKAKERDELMSTLQSRFEEQMQRHKGMKWAAIEARVRDNPAALKSLHMMEASGGEPDVVAHDKKSGQYTFFDCSPESPRERRSLCFDAAAREARKEHKPRSSAMEMAAEMGVSLLTEEQYRGLQEFGDFDTKTSSWIATPSDIRTLGGAVFCDKRYGKVFLYHNGAESYYASRGFRASLQV